MSDRDHTIRWAVMPGKFTNGSDAMLGSIKVGVVFRRAKRVDLEQIEWVGQTFLPGTQGSESPFKVFPTEDAAKEYVETVVRLWFKQVAA